MDRSVNRLEVEGATVAFRSTASMKDDRTASLILGGAFANVFSFQLIEHALADLGPVVLIDLPGAGFAGPAPPGFTQADALRVLRAAVERLGLTRLRIVAICNGAPIAHALAAGMPERIAHLVLGSTTLDPITRHRPSLERLCATLDRSDAEAMSDDILSMLMGSETHPDVQRGGATRSLLSHTLRETPPQDMARMASSLRMSLAPWPDRPMRVSGVEAVAYTGALDPYTTTDDCRDTAAAVDGCRAYSIRNADHMVHVERPRELAAMLRRVFLDQALDDCDFLDALPR